MCVCGMGRLTIYNGEQKWKPAGCGQRSREFPRALLRTWLLSPFYLLTLIAPLSPEGMVSPGPRPLGETMKPFMEKEGILILDLGTDKVPVPR